MDNYRMLTEDGLRALFVQIANSGVQTKEITPENAELAYLILCTTFSGLLGLTMRNVATLNEYGPRLRQNEQIMTFFPSDENKE